MAGYEQAAPSKDLPSTDAVADTQTCEASYLEEVEALLKFAIFRRHSELRAIFVDCSRSGHRKQEVKLKFNRFEASSAQEFTVANAIQQEKKYGKYQPTMTLYQKLATAIPIEVLETKHAIVAFCNVIKLIHCDGYANINIAIQEALIQARLASAYTCKLQDLFIRKGSQKFFKVGLVMEKLDGSLEIDIDFRKASKMPSIQRVS